MAETERNNSESSRRDTSESAPAGNVRSEQTNGETNICKIFKVPDQTIHENNVGSFKPKILSIGPYHHDSSGLRGMESVKSVCRHSILGSISESYYDRDEIKGLENKARSFYSENIAMEPKQFAEMLLLDGCFILSALTGMQAGRAVGNVLPSETPMTSQGTASSDTMGNRGGGQPQVDLAQHERSNRHDIVHDLFLQDNQIPFFVVEEIGKLAAAEGETTQSLKEKIAKYVEGVLAHYPKAIEISDIRSTDFHHLLHLCHMFFRPSSNTLPHNQATMKCLDFSPQSHRTMQQWHKAVQYREAGIKFRLKNSRTRHSLLDVTFSNGIMEIPLLSIDGNTEFIFSNLIVFENGWPHAGKHINAYVTFMSQLLSDANDVELLARRGIIHILGHQEEILNIFGRLNGLAVCPGENENYLNSTLQSVEAHFRCLPNWWFAWWKHEHCRNPCLAIAALGGITVVLCTVIQALFAVWQYFK